MKSSTASILAHVVDFFEGLLSGPGVLELAAGTSVTETESGSAETKMAGGLMGLTGLIGLAGSCSLCSSSGTEINNEPVVGDELCREL